MKTKYTGKFVNYMYLCLHHTFVSFFKNLDKSIRVDGVLNTLWL